MQHLDIAHCMSSSYPCCQVPWVLNLVTYHVVSSASHHQHQSHISVLVTVTIYLTPHSPGQGYKLHPPGTALNYHRGE
eukprot:2182978-Amphidinium_carterae.1